MALPRPRPELSGLPVYQTGKPAPRGAIKLASNENAYGASKKALAAIRSYKSTERYPSGGSNALVTALSRKYKLSPSRIIIGSGSDEIGDFCARAYLRPKDRVVIPKHTFIRYAMAAKGSGSPVFYSKLLPDLSADIDDLVKVIRKRKPRMVCIANPNNPTGGMIKKRELKRILSAASAATLVILDEAYFEYACLEREYPDGLSYVARHPNLLVLRTFSKVYGLAGLRVGYGIGHPKVIGELHKVRPPFNVNAVAQAAAIAALSDRQHVLRSTKLNISERLRMSSVLEKLGVTVYPSYGNFITIKTAIPGRTLFKMLSRKGIIARDLVPYGLKKELRVTVGTKTENSRFLSAMKSVLPKVK